MAAAVVVAPVALFLLTNQLLLLPLLDDSIHQAVPPIRLRVDLHAEQLHLLGRVAGLGTIVGGRVLDSTAKAQIIDSSIISIHTMKWFTTTQLVTTRASCFGTATSACA
mmetsp:Transcript_36118/g.77002  ORF Transcript_36118/g.77002 Transcript_36118/m.77002 type:complete len:109 (+) Transcript_36118:1965-2291(+)